MANWRTLKLSNRLRWPAVFRYGLAVLLVGIALTISAIAHLGNSPPRFVPLFVLLAIAITFWCAGTRPALLALLVSCLGVEFLAKNHFLAPGFPLAQFLIFFVILSLLELRFTDRTRELEKANRKLQETQAEFLLMSRDLQESKARLEEA
jgi:K+-sensing histidine kinase KdpD